MNLRAVLHTDKGAALTGYEMSLDYAKRASGVGVDVAVPSLGERAAYVYENKTSGPTGNSRYPWSNLQLSLLDGPLEVHLIMTVAAPITEQELLAAATEQMQRITTMLDARDRATLGVHRHCIACSGSNVCTSASQCIA